MESSISRNLHYLLSFIPPSPCCPSPPAGVAPSIHPLSGRQSFERSFWFRNRTGRALGMPRSTDPNKVGKPMPKGTGDRVIIESDEDCPWIFDAKWRGLRVGYARCILENDRLLIGDFLVKDSQCVPWRFLDKLRCLLHIRCPQRNFRGHGIGSKLIDTVISQAQRSSVSEIWGSLTADDIKNTEHLLSFYRRRGFTIRDPDGECLEIATKKIALALSPKNLNAVQ